MTLYSFTHRSDASTDRAFPLPPSLRLECFVIACLLTLCVIKTAAAEPVRTDEHLPLVAYGTCRVVDGYAGPALQVQRAGDDARADMPFDQEGRFDWEALSKFSQGADVAISKWYNEGSLGHLGDAEQDDFKRMPLISGQIRIADCPSVTTIASQNQFLQIPNAVAVNNNALSLILTARITSIKRFENLLLVGNKAAGDAIQLISYPAHGVSVSFARSAGNTPGLVNARVVSLVSTGAGHWTLRYGNGAAYSMIGFGDSILRGGTIGDVPEDIKGRAIKTTGGGEIASVLLYAHDLSVDELSAISDAVAVRFGISRTTNDTVVFYGESNTEGFGKEGYDGYVRQLADRLPKSVRVINSGIAGLRMSEASEKYTALVAPLFDASHRRNILFFWPGANDVWADQKTASQEMDNILAVIRLAKATGWQVIVATEPDRRGKEFQAREKNVLNSLITLHAIDAGYSLCPIGDSSLIGTSGQSADPAWFTDGAHFTIKGAQAAADACEPVILSLLR